ncbi:MAG: HEAT repeat domain-containing protein [Planctomycetota bacterium]
MAGCGGPAKNNSGPANKEPLPLILTDVKSVNHIINQLLLFSSDNPFDWPKARSELRRSEKSLPPAILTRLKETESANPSIARTARESLARQGKISFYLTKFDSADYQEWTQARENLIKLGSEAIDNMVLALAGKFVSLKRDPELCKRVRQELDLIGSAALPTIKTILLQKNIHPDIKKQLALTMVEMDQLARSDIQELIRQNQLDLSLIFLKIFAAPDFTNQSLIWFKETEKLLASSPHWQVRGQAALTLGVFPDKQSLSPLLKTLSDPEPFVRQCVARALGTLKNPAAVEDLIKQLNNPSPSGLTANTRFQDEELTKTIIDSLNQITGEKFQTAPEWQEWWGNR